jgi:hypothetical protein
MTDTKTKTISKSQHVDGFKIRRRVALSLFVFSCLLILFSYMFRPFILKMGTKEEDFACKTNGSIQGEVEKDRIKIFETVKSEIGKRLENEFSLALYQFVVIAAVFAFMIKTRWEQKKADPTSGDLRLVLGISAMALLIIDFHLKTNEHMLHSLGQWGRCNYEVFLKYPIDGWEQFFFNTDFRRALSVTKI